LLQQPICDFRSGQGLRSPDLEIPQSSARIVVERWALSVERWALLIRIKI
jgi:hypothetical protein